MEIFQEARESEVPYSLCHLLRKTGRALRVLNITKIDFRESHKVPWFICIFFRTVKFLLWGVKGQDVPRSRLNTGFYYRIKITLLVRLRISVVLFAECYIDTWRQCVYPSLYPSALRVVSSWWSVCCVMILNLLLNHKVMEYFFFFSHFDCGFWDVWKKWFPLWLMVVCACIRGRVPIYFTSSLASERMEEGSPVTAVSFITESFRIS